MTNFAAALSAFGQVLWNLVKVGALIVLVLIVFKIAFNVLTNKKYTKGGGGKK